MWGKFYFSNFTKHFVFMPFSEMVFVCEIFQQSCTGLCGVSNQLFARNLESLASMKNKTGSVSLLNYYIVSVSD